MNKTDIMCDFILDRSEVLFTQHGYKNTSMEKIAETCEISKPTLYNYFSSKTAIFFGIYSRFQDGLAAKATEVMGQDKDKRLIIEEIIDLSLTVLEEKRSFLKMMVREHHVAIQECEDVITEHINFEFRRREENSRKLGEFMSDIVCPEILDQFGIPSVGKILVDLLEGAFWDSIMSEPVDHEKRKKLIMRLLKNGILS
ncbi:MAG: helix-turn-helix transcriptional regulator [Candidatus Aminicenantes bacterium]|nr:helix-turn-helix transcriptional regulator [Candidatus Aminicenantes bacterium]